MGYKKNANRSKFTVLTSIGSSALCQSEISRDGSQSHRKLVLRPGIGSTLDLWPRQNDLNLSSASHSAGGRKRRDLYLPLVTGSAEAGRRNLLPLPPPLQPSWAEALKLFVFSLAETFFSSTLPSFFFKHRKHSD